VGTSLDQLIMQGVTEAAAFIDGTNGVASLNFVPHPLHQTRDRKALGGFGMLMVSLDRRGDLLQVYVQSQFEHRVGIALRRILCCRVHVMIGLMVCFHSPERVPVLHALLNPSWHLTPVGRFCLRFDIIVPAWLSFGR
jgi:hypothetical protein